jgi:hypothetical protein
LAPPTAVPSNVLWFDAEYSTITLDGAGVRRWDDVLLRANASQSEAGSRPTIIADDIAGKRGVAFDGSNDFLNLGTIGGILPTAATVIIAFSLSNSLTAGDDVYSLISSLANISSAWRNGSSNGAWGLFTSSIISGFPTAMPVNGTLIVSIRASTAHGLEFRLNSIVKSSIAPGGYTYSSAGNFVIGVSDSVSLSNAFQGSIHSIAFYNTVLNDTELKSQEEYMRWRYGFVFNPDDAPFSFSNTLHDERAVVFRLEDDSILEAA